MNAVEKAIAEVKAYNDEMLPLSLVSELTGIQKTTLTSGIRSYTLPAKFDGYRYHFAKKVVIDLIEKNRSAILGWILKVDLSKELDAGRKLEWMCKSNNMPMERDYCGRIRLPPETEDFVLKNIKSYLSGEIMVMDGEKYYSLVKTARDAALKKYPNKGKGFTNARERAYKCFYKWAVEGEVEHLKVKGMKQIYFSEFVYEKLISTISIKDCARLAGVSRQTIHKWLRNGILKRENSGWDRVSYKTLDDALVLRAQMEFSNGSCNVGNSVSPISDIYSEFWRSKVALVRMTGGRFFVENKRDGEKKDDFISRVTGWPVYVVRAIRRISKLRRQFISLDKKTFDDGEEALVDTVVDSYAVDHCTMMLMQDVENFLSKDDLDFVKQLYGFEDDLTEEELAVKFGISVRDINTRRDDILLRLNKWFDKK